MNQKIINICYKIKLLFKLPNIKRKLKNKKYTCAYIGTPFYGNLGDQQIRSSSIEYLKKQGLNVVEIDYYSYFYLKNYKMPHIKIVVLQGGGNLGDVYLLEQYFKDDVIRNFKDKKIIIFPQTLHFENEKNKGEFDISKKIFAIHPNLTVVAREKISYEQMKVEFNNNTILLSPDIVLSSNYTKKYNYTRKNQILFLCRKDLEKSISDKNISHLKELLKNNYSLLENDTYKYYDMFDVTRNCELKKIFKQIAKSKLVITDRLHGMIFCAITNTPCIVLPNYNHKIKSTYYNWLEKFEYIKFVENIDEINLDLIKKVSSTKPNWKGLNKEFEFLSKSIKEL
ncbi:MAG: polysaccharide pyruvyl transferase family protein [Clostridia bacterium]|nr:polysaccharide pyruvyl transferase family protein [Clostridia bacterium]